LTKFYSGLALGALGLPGQATAEIDQAIRANPTPAFTGPAERLRDSMVSTRQGQRRLSAEVRLGFFYDDNVPVLPNASAGELLVGLLRNGNRDSTGELFGLRADYAWLRTDQWEATIGYSFFGTYNNDLPSFNILSNLGSLGTSYRTAVDNMLLLLGGQYSFDALWLDQRWFIQRHTGSAYASLVESSRYLTQVFARYQHKNFNQIIDTLPAENRDGSNWMAGGTQVFRFSEDRHYLKIGCQLDWDDTVGSNYEYVGNRITAGGQYTLPWYASASSTTSTCISATTRTRPRFFPPRHRDRQHRPGRAAAAAELHARVRVPVDDQHVEPRAVRLHAQRLHDDGFLVVLTLFPQVPIVSHLTDHLSIHFLTAFSLA
jgi:hypothetical protein